jgi:hypothetical protein
VDWKIEKNEGSGRSTERTTEAVDAVKKIMEKEWKTSFRHVFEHPMEMGVRRRSIIRFPFRGKL